MWLNSCAMMPWISSRVSSLTAPKVTPSAASVGSLPAAERVDAPFLIPQKNLRHGTPDAIAISSTTFKTAVRQPSSVWKFTRLPPSHVATIAPPRDNCRKLDERNQSDHGRDASVTQPSNSQVPMPLHKSVVRAPTASRDLGMRE